MDQPADVFSAVPLVSGLFLDAEFTAPWCVRARVGPEDCAPYVPVPDSIIAFHYVYEGELVLEVGDDLAWVRVGPGEVIILPRNDPHRLGSAPGGVPMNADELIQPDAGRGLARIEHGGGGARTRLVCGFLGCDRQYDPLLAMLPPAITVTLPDAATGEWFRGSMRLAAREATFARHGASQKLAKLTELLFLDAMHEYLKEVPDEAFSWFGGLSDRRILRSLTLIHEQPRRRWTTEALAREVGMSRSAFAARFTELLGVPPVRYLTRQRLHLAARRLVETPDALAKIAFDVGYDSEAAFNRAFKRAYGLPPAAWRESRRRGRG